MSRVALFQTCQHTGPFAADLEHEAQCPSRTVYAADRNRAAQRLARHIDMRKLARLRSRCKVRRFYNEVKISFASSRFCRSLQSFTSYFII